MTQSHSVFGPPRPHQEALSRIITRVWLELEQVVARLMLTREEAERNFVQGKREAFRLVLPLLKGDLVRLKLIDSRVVFLPGYSEQDALRRARVLKKILLKNVQTLQHGGRNGIMKPWLEGHIEAIGFALNLLQPLLRDGSPIDENYLVMTATANC